MYYNLVLKENYIPHQEVQIEFNGNKEELTKKINDIKANNLDDFIDKISTSAKVLKVVSGERKYGLGIDLVEIQEYEMCVDCE